jgi:hypothetical protein
MSHATYVYCDQCNMRCESAYITVTDHAPTASPLDPFGPGEFCSIAHMVAYYSAQP